MDPGKLCLKIGLFTFVGQLIESRKGAKEWKDTDTCQREVGTKTLDRNKGNCTRIDFKTPIFSAFLFSFRTRFYISAASLVSRSGRDRQVLLQTNKRLLFNRPGIAALRYQKKSFMLIHVGFWSFWSRVMSLLMNANRAVPSEHNHEDGVHSKVPFFPSLFRMGCATVRGLQLNWNAFWMKMTQHFQTCFFSGQRKALFTKLCLTFCVNTQLHSHTFIPWWFAKRSFSSKHAMWGKSWIEKFAPRPNLSWNSMPGNRTSRVVPQLPGFSATRKDVQVAIIHKPSENLQDPSACCMKRAQTIAKKRKRTTRCSVIWDFSAVFLFPTEDNFHFIQNWKRSSFILLYLLISFYCLFRKALFLSCFQSQRSVM